jgi:hypothetical protein
MLGATLSGIPVREWPRLGPVLWSERSSRPSASRLPEQLRLPSGATFGCNRQQPLISISDLFFSSRPFFDESTNKNVQDCCSTLGCPTGIPHSDQLFHIFQRLNNRDLRHRPEFRFDC